MQPMSTSPPISQCDPVAELAALQQAMHACTRCPALVASRSRVVPGDGNPQAKIVFVGEGPGADEDREGLPFVGRAGQLLNQCLGLINLHRGEVFITNVIKCRPDNNRDPLPEEIANCREHLFAQLMLINPTVVCTLGRFALQTLVKSDLSITAMHGKPIKRHGMTFFPLFHPSAALRDEQKMADLTQDFADLRDFLVSQGVG